MGRVLSLVFSMLFTIGATASAQTATGTISGTVHDSTGAVIPGVAVTTRNVATGASRSAVTDAQGRYRIANVEPGEYELRAALTGFRTAVRSSLIVTVGGITETDLELTVGSVADQYPAGHETPWPGSLMHTTAFTGSTPTMRITAWPPRLMRSHGVTGRRPHDQASLPGPGLHQPR
jgi:hypothetical protein